MLAYGSAHWASKRNNASMWALKPCLACLGLSFFSLSFERVDDRLFGPFYFFFLKYRDDTSFFSPEIQATTVVAGKSGLWVLTYKAHFSTSLKPKQQKISPKTRINQFSNLINPKNKSDHKIKLNKCYFP
jgi:hypothetical protein